MDSTLFVFTKFFLTIFVIILIPVYWKSYGIKNFLWLSDVALFLTLIALWINSGLLISVVVISILPMEMIWNLDFFTQLFSGRNLFGVADYMFDNSRSLFVRSLSLFHIFLPVIWIYYLYHWGYNDHALWLAIGLVWVILTVSFLFTHPRDNINWVYYPYVKKWQWMPAPLWLITLLVGVPLCVIVPMHFLMKHVF